VFVSGGQYVGHSDGYTEAVSAVAVYRRRRKITATLDPELLAVVDAYVAAHPETVPTS